MISVLGTEKEMPRHGLCFKGLDEVLEATDVPAVRG